MGVQVFLLQSNTTTWGPTSRVGGRVKCVQKMSQVVHYDQVGCGPRIVEVLGPDVEFKT